jgi:hypothetical protein
LENYKRNLDAYNEVIKEAKSPFLPMVETEKGDVDGDPAVQLTVTMPQLPEDQQPPQYAQMMETMVGPGGKMASWLVPVDEHRIAIGCVTKEHLQKMIEIIKQGKPGLESNADVAKTAALLPAGAPAVVYVSPAGILELVKRMAFAMAPPEAMVNVKIPEFPATPPIGFAVTTGADEVQTCLVIPAEVLQAIVPYIAKIRSQGNP